MDFNNFCEELTLFENSAKKVQGRTIIASPVIRYLNREAPNI